MKIITICVILIFIVTFVVLAKKYKTELKDFFAQEAVKNQIKQWCVDAEKFFIGTKLGKERLAYVCGKLASIVPPALQSFVTEQMIEDIVTAIFKEISKILDDGSTVASL